MTVRYCYVCMLFVYKYSEECASIAVLKAVNKEDGGWELNREFELDLTQ